MNLLLINQAFYPDESATSQYAYELCRQLQADGVAVTVLTSNRGYLQPASRYKSQESISGIEIKRVWSPAFSRKYRVLRVMDAMIMNVAFLLAYIRLGSFDCSVCLTSPPGVGIFLSLFNSKSRGKLVHWAMDINPDQAIKAGWIGAGSALARMLLRLQQNFYMRCDLIIVLDRFMKDLLLQKGVPENRLALIPLWWDPDFLKADKTASEEFLKEFSIANKKVIMYSGNHSLCHPLDAMLQAAYALRDKKEYIFVFIGGGSRVLEVRAFKKKNNLENILQIAYQPRSKLVAVLNAASMHVVSCGEEFVGIVHPSKIYPLLALGKPCIVLGNEDSSLTDLLNQGCFGWQVPSFDGPGFLQCLEEFDSMDLNQLQEKKNSSKELANNFTREKVVSKIKEVIA